MGRPLRIEYENACYHVMSHGIGKTWIYKDQRDFENFKDVLYDVVIKYKFKFSSAVLMKSHYHLSLHTPLANLSAGMVRLNSAYAKKYNKRYNRKGHLFRHRYLAKLIQEEQYFLTVVRYTNQNISKVDKHIRVEEYDGNILKSYLEGDSKAVKILGIDSIINEFHGIDGFLQWLNNKQPDPFNNLKDDYFLGKSDWINDIKNKYLDDDLNCEINKHDTLMRHSEQQGLIFRELEKYKCRNDYNNLVIYCLNKFSQLKNDEIALKMQVKNPDAVSQRVYKMKAKIHRDVTLMKIIQSIENLIAGKSQK